MASTVTTRSGPVSGGNPERAADSREDSRWGFEDEDCEWDAFLATVSGAHHVQSSLWGLLKRTMGYRAARLKLYHEGRLVAGAQLLIRRLRHLGSVAYVPKGPVIASDAPPVLPRLARELQEYARAERLRLLLVQPPYRAEAIAAELPRLGFVPSPVQVGRTATCILDLRAEEESLLAGMKRNTRYKIRNAQRRGVHIREGTAQDIAKFHAVLAATAARRNFIAYPESYYRRLWELFAPEGHVRLSFAEYEGEVVSGHLLIGFGDTAVNKMSAWMGARTGPPPNELLQWASIRWARNRGHHWYDFDGIETDAARAILDGQPLPDTSLQSTSSFKLDFGSQPLLVPPTHAFVANRALGWAFRSVISPIMRSPRAQEAVNRLRTVRGGP